MPDLDPNSPENVPTPPPRPSGCLTAFLIVLGAFLLAPGLCFVVVGGSDRDFITIGVIILAIAAALIAFGIGRARR